MRAFLGIFYLCVCATFSMAQIQFIARVDSTSMWIGDQQNITFTYKAPTYQPPPDFHMSNLDTCSFLDIISQSAWLKTQQDNEIKMEKKYRFSIFDEGTFVMPSVFVVAGNDSMSTSDIPIHIQGIEPDSTGLLPIKGIIREQNKWTDYLVWIIGVLVLILSYVLYRYYLYRQKMKAIPEVVIPETPLLPHEIAIQKLLELKQSKLWEKGEVKEYHVQLTFILREYLEHRFHFPALESTSNEIIKDLKQTSLNADQLLTVNNILNIADWVKFAKGIPEENANALAIDDTLDLVYATQSTATDETFNQSTVE